MTDQLCHLLAPMAPPLPTGPSCSLLKLPNISKYFELREPSIKVECAKSDGGILCMHGLNQV